MRSFQLVPLTDLIDIYDHLREPVNKTERNRREGPFPYYGATGQVGWINDFRQDGKFVLLGEDGAPFLDPNKSKAYIVEGKCWVNNHAHVLKGKKALCDDDFLCYALNWADYSEAVTGSTRLKLPQNTMNRLLIPNFTIEKQRQIAAKLKAQLAEVDRARQAAQAQLRELSLILNHVIEEHILRAISKGKNLVELGEVATISAKIVNPTLPEYCYLPHISAENIEKMTGRLLAIKSAKDDRMTSGKYLFDEGDILYSKLRPYLRKVAQPSFKGVCSADMYPIKVVEELLDATFLKLLLTSNLFTDYANEQSARSRMPKLNREQLFAFKFVLPSVIDQQECINRTRDAVDCVSQAIESAKIMLSEIDLLPQKILAQAFEI